MTAITREEAPLPRPEETAAGFRRTPPAAVPLRASWIHGSISSKHNTDPDIQVHRHDEHTFVLRQNMAVNFEAPFMFLLFGDARAVLIDTGATASERYFPLRRTVDVLIDGWLREHPRTRYGLLVLHTHAHGDHVAGEAQFADRPRTEVVGADRETAWKRLGLDGDSGSARIDLGSRVLECLASPGHHPSAVTFYDPHSGFLLTGDTVYPGRLHVQDLPAFRKTLARLVGFARSHPVAHVLGCHIEMFAEPRSEYPGRSSHHPDERPLEMTVEQLIAVERAAAEIGPGAGRRVFEDFVLVLGG